MKKKISDGIIIFIAIFTGSCIMHSLAFKAQQKTDWDIIHFRNTVVDFQNYVTAHLKDQETEEYKQSCINFNKAVKKHYKDHENSEFAFCYKLFLQPDLCYSPEKIDCFIEVLNQILEQLEERINKRFWLLAKIFGPSHKQIK